MDLGYHSESDEERPVPALPATHRLEMAPEAAPAGHGTRKADGADAAFATTAQVEHYDPATVAFSGNHTRLKRSGEQKRLAKRLKRARKHDWSEDAFAGPWAGFDELDDQVYESDEGRHTRHLGRVDDDDTAPSQLFAEKLSLMPPKDVDIDFSEPGRQVFQVPSRVAHTLSGHSKGVTRLRLFPATGHLLLSAGNDSEIKLWDMYHDNELLRGYYGHSQAVRDVAFVGSGHRFVSCGFDRRVILWDTKSGSVVQEMEMEAVPTCVLVHPENEHQVLVALSSGKIHHYDWSSPTYRLPIQTYDHHQSSVNFLMAVDSGHRFLSASDDKSVRIWDWQINIPIKTIQEPGLHSVPRGVVAGADIALQTMASTVDLVQNFGKFRTLARSFRGHNVGGYAVDLAVSADGRVLVSGDSRGLGVFWDVKTGKILKKLKISGKVVTCVQPHPQEPSTVVAAGLTGDIYICK